MSETVGMYTYLRVIDNRQFKLAPEEVNYRKTEDEKESCAKCLHFFTRKIDGWAVCEILRDEKETKGEPDEKPIDPEYVCDFFTKDGTKFPLLDD